MWHISISIVQKRTRIQFFSLVIYFTLFRRSCIKSPLSHEVKRCSTTTNDINRDYSFGILFGLFDFCLKCLIRNVLCPLFMHSGILAHSRKVCLWFLLVCHTTIIIRKKVNGIADRVHWIQQQFISPFLAVLFCHACVSLRLRWRMNGYHETYIQISKHEAWENRLNEWMNEPKCRVYTELSTLHTFARINTQLYIERGPLANRCRKIFFG